MRTDITSLTPLGEFCYISGLEGFGQRSFVFFSRLTMPYNTSSEPLGACCLDLMLVDRRGWMSRRCFSWWHGPYGSAPMPMCFGQLSFSICFGVVAGSFAGSCQSFLGPGCIPGGRAVGQVRAGRLGSGPRAQHPSLCCCGCR